MNNLNEFLDFFFEPQGKLRRFHYFMAYMSCIGVLLLLFFTHKVVYSFVVGTTLEMSLFINMVNAFLVGLCLLPLISLWIITIKRFHDLRMSGFSTLFLLVPFVNIYYQVILFFKQGPRPYSDTFIKSYDSYN